MGERVKDVIHNFIENKLDPLEEPKKNGKMPTVEHPKEIVKEPRGQGKGPW